MCLALPAIIVEIRDADMAVIELGQAVAAARRPAQAQDEPTLTLMLGGPRAPSP